MLKPILLVEDDPGDLELTLVALGKSQLANEVIVARDGQEAIDYLRVERTESRQSGGHPARLEAAENRWHGGAGNHPHQ